MQELQFVTATEHSKQGDWQAKQTLPTAIVLDGQLAKH
jgi:hypothetical protein